MISHRIKFQAAALLLLGVALLTYACTRVEDNTRGASLLSITGVEGFSGSKDPTSATDTGKCVSPGTASTPLLSDTCIAFGSPPPEFCGVCNDNATLTFANNFLQIGPGAGVGSPSFLNDIIVNRYRVDYFRPNGRNTPGVDVPFGIDGTMNVHIPINSNGSGSIIIVRHDSKREPPLSELDNGQSEGVLTANAQIRCYGQDL